jgi:hypothetical protein
MRKDLMEAVLGAASAVLFAPAIWTGPTGAVAVRVFQGGGDVEVDLFGEQARRATHWFRAIKAEFAGIAIGQTIMLDGESYEILDFRKPMDAPLEWEIAARLLP